MIVNLPDGRRVKFPDNAPEHEIYTALGRDFPGASPVADRTWANIQELAATKQEGVGTPLGFLQNVGTGLAEGIPEIVGNVGTAPVTPLPVPRTSPQTAPVTAAPQQPRQINPALTAQLTTAEQPVAQIPQPINPEMRAAGPPHFTGQEFRDAFAWSTAAGNAELDAQHPVLAKWNRVVNAGMASSAIGKVAGQENGPGPQSLDERIGATAIQLLADGPFMYLGASFPSALKTVAAFGTPAIIGAAGQAAHQIAQGVDEKEAIRNAAIDVAHALGTGLATQLGGVVAGAPGEVAGMLAGPTAMTGQLPSPEEAGMIAATVGVAHLAGGGRPAPDVSTAERAAIQAGVPPRTRTVAEQQSPFPEPGANVPAPSYDHIPFVEPPVAGPVQEIPPEPPQGAQPPQEYTPEQLAEAQAIRARVMQANPPMEDETGIFVNPRTGLTYVVSEADVSKMDLGRKSGDRWVSGIRGELEKLGVPEEQWPVGPPTKLTRQKFEDLLTKSRGPTLAEHREALAADQAKLAGIPPEALEAAPWPEPETHRVPPAAGASAASQPPAEPGSSPPGQAPAAPPAARPGSQYRLDGSLEAPAVGDRTGDMFGTETLPTQQDLGAGPQRAPEHPGQELVPGTEPVTTAPAAPKTAQGKEMTRGLYRGVMEDTPHGRNLSGIQSIEQLGGSKVVPENAPFEYFTTDSEDAESYANRDQAILKHYEKQTPGRGLEGFRILHGHEPRRGEVKQFDVPTGKTFDLTDMGVNVDQFKMIEKVNNLLGNPPLPNKWGWKDVPENVNDVLEHYMLLHRSGEEPTWTYLKNNQRPIDAMLAERGISPKTPDHVTGSYFARFLSDYGFDSVAYMHQTKNGPVKHIAVVKPEVKTWEPPVPKKHPWWPKRGDLSSQLAGPQRAPEHPGQELVPGTEPVTTAPTYTDRATSRVSGIPSEEPPVKLSAVIGNVEKALAKHSGTTFTSGMTNGKRGFWRVGPNVIRTRAPYDIDALSHEIGHSLHETLFPGAVKQGPNGYEIGAQTIPDSLKAEIRQFSPENTPRPLTEGIAGFVKEWLTRPHTTEEVAPKLTKHFESVIGSDPDLWSALTTARAKIDTYQRGGTGAKILGGVSYGEGRHLDRPMTRAARLLTNDLAFVEKAVTGMTGGKPLPRSQDPFKAFERLTGLPGKAREWIYGRGPAAVTGQPTSPSLRKIWAPIADAEEEAGWNKHILAKQYTEMMQAGLNTPLSDANGGTADARTAAIKECQDYLASEDPKKAALYDKVHGQTNQFMAQVVHELTAAGRFSPEQEQAFLSKWQNYVPTNRVVPKDAMKQPAAAAAPLKPKTGGGWDVVRPKESYVKNTMAILNVAERIHAQNLLRDLAENTQNSGLFMEKLTEQVTVKAPDLEQFAQDLNDDPQKAVQRLVNVTPKGPRTGNTTMTFWRNGQSELWRVEPELKKAIDNTNQTSQSILMRILSEPAKIQRLAATGVSTDFPFRHIIRQSAGAMIFSKYGVKPWDVAYGLAHAIGRTDLYHEWQSLGGAGAALTSMDRNSLRELLREMDATTPGKKILHAMGHPLATIRALGEQVLDTPQRLAEFGKGTRWGKETNPDKLLEAVDASRDLMNFSHGGTLTKEYSRITPFFNARILGVMKMLSEFKDHPVQTGVRSLAYITAPTLALYSLNRKNPEYQALPEWAKDTSWWIPVKQIFGKGIPTPWGDLDLVPIPRPYFLGAVFAAGPDRLMRYVDEHDPHAVDGYFRDVLGTIVPNAAPTVLQPFLAMYSNKGYTGQTITPEAEKQYSPQFRGGPNTSLVANAVKQVGIDPYQFDYAVRNLTGITGAYAASGVNTALRIAGVGPQNPPAAQPSDIPGLHVFAHNKEASGVNIERFYNRVKELQTAKANTARGAKYLSDADIDTLADLNAIRRDTLDPMRTWAQAVHNDPNMDRTQKRDLLIRQSRLQNRIAGAALSGNDKYLDTAITVWETLRDKTVLSPTPEKPERQR